MKYEIDTVTPMPPRRTNKQAEHDALLDKLKPGQSIKTKCAKTAKLMRNNLYARIKSRNLAHLTVQLRANMDDGYSRVFLAKKEDTKKPQKHIPDHRSHRLL